MRGRQCSLCSRPERWRDPSRSFWNPPPSMASPTSPLADELRGSSGSLSSLLDFLDLHSWSTSPFPAGPTIQCPPPSRLSPSQSWTSPSSPSARPRTASPASFPTSPCLRTSTSTTPREKNCRILFLKQLIIQITRQNMLNSSLTGLRSTSIGTPAPLGSCCPTEREGSLGSISTALLLQAPSHLLTSDDPLMRTHSSGHWSVREGHIWFSITAWEGRGRTWGESKDLHSDIYLRGWGRECRHQHPHWYRVRSRTWHWGGSRNRTDRGGDGGLGGLSASLQERISCWGVFSNWNVSVRKVSPELNT